jgi:hypothetical protein
VHWAALFVFGYEVAPFLGVKMILCNELNILSVAFTTIILHCRVVSYWTWESTSLQDYEW